MRFVGIYGYLEAQDLGAYSLLGKEVKWRCDFNEILSINENEEGLNKNNML